MNKFPTSNSPKHSLGHTTTGKLIYDQIRSFPEFRAACIKWTKKDHLEASQIIREKIRKGYFSKSLWRDPKSGTLRVGYAFDLKKLDNERAINSIAEAHLFLASKKS